MDDVLTSQQQSSGTNDDDDDDDDDNDDKKSSANVNKNAEVSDVDNFGFGSAKARKLADLLNSSTISISPSSSNLASISTTSTSTSTTSTKTSTTSVLGLDRQARNTLLALTDAFVSVARDREGLFLYFFFKT